MPLASWFWVGLLLYVFFAGWRDYNPERPWYRWGIAHVILLGLLVLLGYGVFHGPVT